MARVWRKFHLLTFCFRLHYYILYIWLDLCKCSGTVYSPIVSRLYKLVCTYLGSRSRRKQGQFSKMVKVIHDVGRVPRVMNIMVDNYTFWSVFLYIHHCKTIPHCSITFCYRRGQSVLDVWTSRAGPAPPEAASSQFQMSVCIYLINILCSLHSRLSHGIKPKAPVSQ